MTSDSNSMPTIVMMTLAVIMVSTVSGSKMFSSCGLGMKKVALTFDDGPWTAEGGTSKILDELDTLSIPATFFVTPAAMGDDKTELDKRCAIVRREVANGHSVQMHSWDHKKITNRMSNGDLEKSIGRVQEWLKTCGAHPTMFRPPFGVMNNKQADHLSDSMGLVVAQWNVEVPDNESSAKDTMEEIMDEFKSGVKDGNSAVILLHDQMMKSRPGLLKMIFNKFTAMGYTFVTADDCYASCKSAICRPEKQGPRKGSGIYMARGTE